MGPRLLGGVFVLLAMGLVCGLEAKVDFVVIAVPGCQIVRIQGRVDLIGSVAWYLPGYSLSQGAPETYTYQVGPARIGGALQERPSGNSVPV
ncbi:hypothetical protein KAU37_01935 [Candidatus Bipolaricaulota bacterium]|nr:hypothetical protein [Candidatus Bipolaricaulota bacterium]